MGQHQPDIFYIYGWRGANRGDADTGVVVIDGWKHLDATPITALESVLGGLDISERAVLANRDH